MSVWSEVKRRNVVKVGMAYVVVGWIMLEVASVLAPALNLPAWATTFVVFLLTLGFPVALVLAWAYELTPDGVKRAEDVPLAESITPETGRKLNYFVIGLLIVAVVFLAAENFFGRGDDVAASANAASDGLQPSVTREVLPNSVAVLPFENLSPDPDNEFFAKGIHDTILHEIANIKDLTVIARNSVLRYADGLTPISKVAEELNVETVMEGSIQVAEGRVLVTAQLIDPVTEAHLWSQNYNRELAGIFEIQADIARRIALALEAELTQDERAALDRPAMTSQEAYELYLRAMAIWDGSETAIGSPSLRNTIESLLDQSIAADPDFALPYVQRALVYLLTLNYEPVIANNVASRVALEQRALTDVNRALALDPDLAAAHRISARIHQYNWRARDAQAAYGRAYALSPNDPTIASDYAVFYANSGRTAEALQLALRAVELDPNNFDSYIDLASVQSISGNTIAAAASARRVTELNPTMPNGYKDLGEYETVLGDSDSALENLRIAERLFEGNSNPVFTAQLGYNYGRLGQLDDAMRIFRWLQQQSATIPIPQTAWILAYLGIGDEAHALDWMQEAAENPQFYEGHFGMMWIAVNGMVDPVLEQPEFVEARSRIAFGSRQGGG